jgi:hypothetical protein
MTMKKKSLRQFAHDHKRIIRAWQKWARAQSGKTYTEIDWTTEPGIYGRPKAK